MSAEVALMACIAGSGLAHRATWFGAVALLVVAFVNRQDYGFPRPSQPFRNFLIRYGNPVFYIHQHDDGIGFLDSDLNLTLDLFADI